MMLKALVIAALLIGLITLTNAEGTDCSDPNTDHLRRCEQFSLCAWKHKKCKCPRAGDDHCELVCTSDISQWCNGLSEGDPCFESPASTSRCTQVGCRKRSKLICLVNPYALDRV